MGSKISTHFAGRRKFKGASVEEVFVREDGKLATISGKYGGCLVHGV